MTDGGAKLTLGRPGRLRLETDPVCGMKVDPATAKGGSHAHAGKTYWFCNPRCRERFAANPLDRPLDARDVPGSFRDIEE